MYELDHDLEARALKYAELCGKGLQLTSLLGDGTDGKVWKTSRDTAVKALRLESGYWNEHDAYERMGEYGFTERVDGFWIPKLIGCNHELKVIEMDLMAATPYIIDFAKVRIDRPPDFSPETLADIEARGFHAFGDNWPQVCVIMASLESIGIYYVDPQPDNIVFAKPADG